MMQAFVINHITSLTLLWITIKLKVFSIYFLFQNYFQLKGGVDTLDQLVRNYTTKRKSRRWTMVLFFNMLDIAAVNALVIWSQITNFHANKSHRRRIFIEELGKALISDGEQVQPIRGEPAQGSSNKSFFLINLF